jgi:DNA-binding response OmpR family regulator
VVAGSQEILVHLYDGREVRGRVIGTDPQFDVALVQVVMLTGHGTVESALEGLRSGATDYLMKPIDIDELIAKAEEAFVRWQIMEEKIRVAEGEAPTKKQ